MTRREDVGPNFRNVAVKMMMSLVSLFAMHDEEFAMHDEENSIILTVSCAYCLLWEESSRVSSSCNHSNSRRCSGSRSSSGWRGGRKREMPSLLDLDTVLRMALDPR